MHLGSLFGGGLMPLQRFALFECSLVLRYEWLEIHYALWTITAATIDIVITTSARTKYCYYYSVTPNYTVARRSCFIWYIEAVMCDNICSCAKILKTTSSMQCHARWRKHSVTSTVHADRRRNDARKNLPRRWRRSYRSTRSRSRLPRKNSGSVDCHVDGDFDNDDDTYKYCKTLWCYCIGFDLCLALCLPSTSVSSVFMVLYIILIVCDPTIRQPGFDLPRQQWSLLNRFRTERGHCGACRRKCRLTDTDLCPCGETQTMSHIVESCSIFFSYACHLP